MGEHEEYEKVNVVVVEVTEEEKGTPQASVVHNVCVAITVNTSSELQEATGEY